MQNSQCRIHNAEFRIHNSEFIMHSVILSAAKDLLAHIKILRYAQNDNYIRTSYLAIRNFIL